MSAPKPINFDALSSAWNDPIRYAAELQRYYLQLQATGHRESDRPLIKEEA
ncbi:MAG: hypothetical protein ACTIL0_07120 [Microbacterium gubbeenense]